MQFTLNVPFIGKEFLDFRVMEWLVDEGDDITPGTDLCVLRAVSRQRVERWKKQSRFRLRRQGGDQTEQMKIRHSPPLITVTAGEAGRLATVVVPAGELVRQGEPIATMGTGEGGGEGGEFHAVANMTGIDLEGAG